MKIYWEKVVPASKNSSSKIKTFQVKTLTSNSQVSMYLEFDGFLILICTDLPTFYFFFSILSFFDRLLMRKYSRYRTFDQSSFTLILI